MLGTNSFQLMTTGKCAGGKCPRKRISTSEAIETLSQVQSSKNFKQKRAGFLRWKRSKNRLSLQEGALEKLEVKISQPCSYLISFISSGSHPFSTISLIFSLTDLVVFYVYLAWQFFIPYGQNLADKHSSPRLTS